MNRRLLLIVALLVALALRLTAAEAESSSTIPEKLQAAAAALPPEARPQVMTLSQSGALYAVLPNGCEIILKEKHSAPVATVQAWVRTGAINEGQWMGAGLSHFCEHMLFKGTTKRPTGVLDQEIRGAGGDDNAYTSSERTVYHITTAASGFDTSFDALADMVMDSTFPPDETKTEHSVVYKEIERAMDNPDDLLYETFERTRYQEHPYRVPVLGYPDRFKRVTRDDVFAYYQQRYTPQVTTFIAVGDFDSATVLPKMARTLATWQRKSVAPSVITEEPEQVAPRSVQLTHPLCEVPKIIIGFPSVSIRHPDLYALDLLASILGDGRSSRLYQDVKDKLGLVLEISASDYTPAYPGHFDVAATAEATKLAAARQAILNVLAEARNKRPTDEELARAKRKVYTQHIFAQMTVDGEAAALGSDWQSAGDLDFSEHYTQRMQQVSADDILRVAKQYLVPEKLNVTVLLPAPKGEKVVPSAAINKAGSSDEKLNAELDQLRKDPSVEKAELLPKQALFQITLKSGLRLVVRQDHALPVVNVALLGLGGARWEPAALPGSSNLMAEMLDRGTTSRSKTQIANEVEDLGATLATASDRDGFGVSISGLSRDVPRLLDLASDCLLRPAFPPDEFEKLQKDVLQEIAQQDESLMVLNSKVLRPLLYGDHPYARQNIGTPQSVEKTTVADLRQIHDAWVKPENLVLSFVGDATASDALKMTNQYFGKLKSGQFKAPQVPPIPPLTGEKAGQQEKPGIAGAILTLAFPGANVASPDREKLEVLSGILSGLGGRLNTALREKQGLAYSVGVFSNSDLDGGAFVFFIQTDAQSVEKSLKGMWDEAKRLRSELVPQAELDSVKSYVVGTEAIALQDQASLARRLATAVAFGEGAGHVFDHQERLAKITPADLKAAAEKYLTPERFAKAVLIPK